VFYKNLTQICKKGIRFKKKDGVSNIRTPSINLVNFKMQFNAHIQQHDITITHVNIAILKAVSKINNSNIKNVTENRMVKTGIKYNHFNHSVFCFLIIIIKYLYKR
jgi:uncharacterized DUF497 family protein